MRQSDVAYQRFREHLFTGRLTLGATVSQTDLVELLAVPLTPLRDAVQRLHNEGLVEVMPRSGIRIRKPDMELIRHTFQLRTMIERECVRRYAEACPAAGTDGWRARTGEIEAMLAADVEPQALERAARTVDEAFHYTIVGALKNPIIDEVYRQTRDRVALIRLDRAYFLSPPMVRATLDEHRRILDALGRHDGDAAAAAMEAHLASSMRRAMGF